MHFFMETEESDTFAKLKALIWNFAKRKDLPFLALNLTKGLNLISLHASGCHINEAEFVNRSSLLQLVLIIEIYPIIST